jgi:hypothetical protein
MKAIHVLLATLLIKYYDDSSQRRLCSLYLNQHFWLELNYTSCERWIAISRFPYMDVDVELSPHWSLSLRPIFAYPTSSVLNSNASPQ